MPFFFQPLCFLLLCSSAVFPCCYTFANVWKLFSNYPSTHSLFQTMSSPLRGGPYDTFHIPSPQALYAETSPPPEPQICILQAVEFATRADIFATNDKYIESLEE